MRGYPTCLAGEGPAQGGDVLVVPGVPIRDRGPGSIPDGASGAASLRFWGVAPEGEWFSGVFFWFRSHSWFQ